MLKPISTTLKVIGMENLGGIVLPQTGKPLVGVDLDTAKQNCNLMMAGKHLNCSKTSKEIVVKLPENKSAVQGRVCEESPGCQAENPPQGTIGDSLAPNPPPDNIKMRVMMMIESKTTCQKLIYNFKVSESLELQMPK